MYGSLATPTRAMRSGQLAVTALLMKGRRRPTIALL